MAAPVEQLTMYYEDSVNLYTTASIPLPPMGGVSKVADLAKASIAKIDDVAIANIAVLDKVPGAGITYYFHDEASDVSGYKILSTTASDIAKTSITRSMNAGDPPTSQLMAAWMTPSGVPGYSGSLPAQSIWKTFLRQKRTVDGLNYSSSWTTRWYRYYYEDEISSWILSGQIAYTIAGGATNTETTATQTHSVITPVTLGATDRLVCKIWANLEEIGDLS